MALNKVKNYTQRDKNSENVYYGYNMDVNNEKCLFASDRQTLIRVPKDTIDRFMRPREALTIDDLIKICKELYKRKYLKLSNILVDIF